MTQLNLAIPQMEALTGRWFREFAATNTTALALPAEYPVSFFLAPALAS